MLKFKIFPFIGSNGAMTDTERAYKDWLEPLAKVIKVTSISYIYTGYQHSLLVVYDDAPVEGE